MKKWQKFIVYAIPVGILILFLLYYLVYNKPHPKYEKFKPAYELTASELFMSYADLKGKSDSLFTGRVIQVEGIIDHVENPDDMVIVVFAFRDGFFGHEGVRCTMMEEYSEMAKQLTPGTEITIKGFCVGFNESDVIFENCTIIE